MGDPPKSLPTVTSDQMAEIERAMADELGISPLRTVENAGRHLASLARDRFLAGEANGRSVVVLAGAGGNGAGAMAAAQRLVHWGARVEVFLVRPRGEYGPSGAGGELAILERLKVPIKGIEDPLATEGADVVVDGMWGHEFRGHLGAEAADAIRWANAERVPVLSLDLPSGMDPVTGRMATPSLKATATLALALPKAGLLAAGAEEFRGELYLGDVGVPEILYRREGLRVGPIFSEADLLRIG